jgi:sulfur relay (sulfurtransferase) complex TusBCD TusD component (DsrE family)
MHLGLVLATGEEGDLALAERLARAALRARHRVTMFLMHDAVAFAPRSELAALCADGAAASYCGTSAATLGIVLDPDAPVGEGSQLDHAQLVRECDRVLTIA